MSKEKVNQKEKDNEAELNKSNEEELNHSNDEPEREQESKKEIYENDIELERLEKLSDDEAIIELDKLTGQNDEIVEKDYLSSLINQEDRLVYYEIENIYHDPKKRTFRNRLRMRKDPPVLIIRDDFGNEAKFYLTENLTDELSETLRQVKRAYYGFNGPSNIEMPEKFVDKIKYYIKNNPFKILATIFLILFLLSLRL